MSFFNELNRRNVTRVAVAYGVAGWLLTEVASVVLPTFQAPGWVLQVLIALLIMGFPLALVFREEGKGMRANRHGIQGRILNATLGTDMCSDIFHLRTGIGKKPDYTSQALR